MVSTMNLSQLPQSINLLLESLQTQQAHTSPGSAAANLSAFPLGNQRGNFQISTSQQA